MLTCSTERTKDDVVIITLVGKLYFETTAKFRDQVQQVVNNSPTKALIINLKDLSFVDSSGLGLLIAARNSIERINGIFRLCCLTPSVNKAMAQTNLLKFFSIFETEDQANVF